MIKLSHIFLIVFLSIPLFSCNIVQKHRYKTTVINTFPKARKGKIWSFYNFSTEYGNGYVDFNKNFPIFDKWAENQIEVLDVKEVTYAARKHWFDGMESLVYWVQLNKNDVFELSFNLNQTASSAEDMKVIEKHLEIILKDFLSNYSKK